MQRQSVHTPPHHSYLLVPFYSPLTKVTGNYVKGGVTSTVTGPKLCEINALVLVQRTFKSL